MIPDDFRIEVVPVHFVSDETTDYEIQLRWTAPRHVEVRRTSRGAIVKQTVEHPMHSEVVYLAVAKDEKEAKELAAQARQELKNIVSKW